MHPYFTKNICMDKFLICTLPLICLHLFILPLVVVHGTKTIPSCNQAPYPKLCNSLSLQTLDKTEFPLRQSAIKATLDHAHRALSLLSTMDISSYSTRARLARDDCLELYSDSIHQLNRSVLSTDPFSSQTWLSAAITNHQTCQNGFNEFNMSLLLQSYPTMLIEFSKYLSNSLAINKATTSFSSIPLKKNIGNRRLLGDGLPEWISISQRKLMQTGSAPSKGDLVVAQDGSGDHTTISEAVGAAAKLSSGNKRFIIYVKRGVYKENVVISRSIRNLMFVGDGIDATIVTASKSYGESTTFASATFAISGDGFMARDMTFENTAGAAKHQAVALRCGSDRSVFYRCSFKGYQDTLYVYTQRQFYRDCDIYGTQDIIFGDGVVVVQNSNIYVRKPLGNQQNTLTAQSRTDPNQNTGIVIHNSNIAASSEFRSVQNSVHTYLGRPWQKYSRTVFMKCSLGGFIDPKGWLPWSGNFALSTLYYGEYMNNGDGASTSGRVTWPGYHVITSAAEAGKFTVGNFLAGNGWIPTTGVPFTSDL